MWRSRLVAITCAALVSLPTVAQVVQTPGGTVEFLGLETWTPAQIQERLGYKSSDQLHYCANDLTKKLGFPEASVMSLREQGRRYFLVSVIEPQRAREIAYRPRPSGRVDLPPTWSELRKATQEPGFLEGGILDYSRTLSGAKTDEPWLSDGTPQRWWPAARRLGNKRDFRTAVHVLSSSGDPNARATAALVLMNFPTHEETWRALLSGLRDPDLLVNAASLQSLNSIVTYHSRKVDWAHSVDDLVPLLHGTNLTAFDFVLKVLAATNVDRSLAPRLFANGGGRLALAYLGAQLPDERGVAHRFFVQMKGEDLGTDPAQWQQWMSSLQSSQ